MTIELESKPTVPVSFTVTGTVIEIITLKGSMSENHYLKIKPDDGAEEYLFNEVGVNMGFTEFINKTVTITGFNEIGQIGWQGREVEGIYVEEIELIQN